MTPAEKMKFEALLKNYEQAHLKIGELQARIFILQSEIEILKASREVDWEEIDLPQKSVFRPKNLAHLTIVR